MEMCVAATKWLLDKIYKKNIQQEPGLTKMQNNLGY